MVEIQIKRPIKIFNSCLCVPAGNSKRNSLARNGLVSNDGVIFYPEEFLPSFNLVKDMGLLKEDIDAKLGFKGENTAFHSELNID